MLLTGFSVFGLFKRMVMLGQWEYTELPLEHYLFDATNITMAATQLHDYAQSWRNTRHNLPEGNEEFGDFPRMRGTPPRTGVNTSTLSTPSQGRVPRPPPTITPATDSEMPPADNIAAPTSVTDVEAGKIVPTEVPLPESPVRDGPHSPDEDPADVTSDEFPPAWRRKQMHLFNPDVSPLRSPSLKSPEAPSPPPSPPRRAQSELSESSSSSSPPPTPPYSHSLPLDMSAATLKTHSGKLPVLHSGDATPALLCEWEVAFGHYVNAKDVQVKAAIGGFHDHRVTNLTSIPKEAERLKKGTFKEFMVEICSLLLPPAWEDNFRITMLLRRQQPTESFYSFALSIRAQNSLLLNTTSHHSDKRLRIHLEPAMCRKLLDGYKLDKDTKRPSPSNLRSVALNAYDVAEIPLPRASKPKCANQILGNYTISKTLGASLMGKVKLATHKVTGEKLAIKILPHARPLSQSFNDASKETCPLREAGLSLLLHHPYICGMREMILLDFIIAHGCLCECIDRKFACQIAPALDYCHRNNVHQDHRLWAFESVRLHLPSAYLLRLYFAAPLNAKFYIDIWFFGVILYILLCKKVPFEDESMPTLHAKIKHGLVEYPVWLSPDHCTPLDAPQLCRPALPATPPETPLRLQDIDPTVHGRLRLSAQMLRSAGTCPRHIPVPEPPHPNPLPPPSTCPSTGASVGSTSTVVLSLSRNPMNVFHSLVSMYFLAHEKLKHEQVYSVSVFTSSQVSILAAEEAETHEKKTVKNGHVVHRDEEQQAPVQVEEKRIIEILLISASEKLTNGKDTIHGAHPAPGLRRTVLGRAVHLCYDTAPSPRESTGTCLLCHNLMTCSRVLLFPELGLPMQPGHIKPTDTSIKDSVV
ncbi:hypothetical protein B0H17DRAFT_1216021 [Mycena rosella]|uniref:Protein kinase domain-containing protein n=1 Tax=Mycena rosella TaxID=1033263 RepID=A0AAD7FY50_MYCRO|nr:hypothetical protein B0H17DRAFT_1216021 [Mycena rosella]